MPVGIIVIDQDITEGRLLYLTTKWLSYYILHFQDAHVIAKDGSSQFHSLSGYYMDA